MSEIIKLLAASVIFLFSHNGQVPIGIAFIIAYPSPDGEGVIPLVVTAKHVIAEQKQIFGCFMSAAADRSRRAGEICGLGLVTWDLSSLKKNKDYWEHPDEGVDIAVFRTQHFSPLNYKPLPLDYVASKEKFFQKDIGIADKVIFPSMLINFMGLTRNYPMTRTGFIAQIPDGKLPIKLDLGKRKINTQQEVIFLDATSIPGVSGSPIFLWPGPRAIHGNFNLGRAKPLLLGVMHGFYPAIPSRREQLKYRENSGIAIIFPAWKLREIIESDAVRERMIELFPAP